MKISKTKIVTSVTCAFFLITSMVCASEMVEAMPPLPAAVAPKPVVLESLFDREMYVDTPQFKSAIVAIRSKPVYFLVPRDRAVYDDLISQLDGIVRSITKNQSMTLEYGWSITRQYIDILLNQMSAGDDVVWAEDDQQKEIIDRLLNINAIRPRQSAVPVLQSAAQDRSLLFGEESEEARIKALAQTITWAPGVANISLRVIDLISKFSLLGLERHSAQISYGLINNGNILKPDYVWNQEFLALLGNVANYPYSYLQPALNFVTDKILASGLNITDIQREAISKGVDTEIADHLRRIHQTASKKVIEDLQLRALTKVFISDGEDFADWSRSIREKDRELSSKLRAFGQFYFKSNCPNKFIETEAGARIFGKLSEWRTNTTQFKAAMDFLKVMDPKAYRDVMVAGGLKRRADVSRETYLDQLTQKGPQPLEGTNWFEANNFNPAVKVDVSDAAYLPFDIAIIDYAGEKEEGKLWSEGKDSHGIVVLEVFKEYAGDLPVPEVIPIDADATSSNIKKLQDALARIAAQTARPTLINLSLKMDGALIGVREAFANCLRKGDVIFLAINNMSRLNTHLAAGEDELTSFLKWLREEAELSSEQLENLHLISRVTSQPYIEWHKRETDGKPPEYFAVVENKLLSQDFGESVGPRDFASFLHQHGAAASGTYYSETYKKFLAGTSFATPAQAGAFAQVLYEFMHNKGMRPDMAIKEANRVFKESLRHHKVQLTADVGTGAVGDDTMNVSLQAVGGLDPSVFGQGMFDYENLISFATTGHSVPLPYLTAGEAIPMAEEEEDLHGIIPQASGAGRLISFLGADQAVHFMKNPTVSFAQVKDPRFKAAVTSWIPKKAIKVSGVTSAIEAETISKEYPGVTVLGFESKKASTEIPLSYHSFKDHAGRDEIATYLSNNPGKTINVTGATERDLEEMIAFSLLYGERVTFDHPLFKSKTLTIEQLNALEPKLLRVYTLGNPVTVTGVSTLPDAIRLVKTYKVKVAGFDDFFDEGKIPLAYLLSIKDFKPDDINALKELLNGRELTVTGVSTLPDAIRLVSAYKVKVAGFGYFFERGEIPRGELSKIDIANARKALREGKELIVTGVRDLVDAIYLAKTYKVKVAGFDDFFERGNLSWAQFQGNYTHMAQEALGEGKVLTVTSVPTLEEAIKLVKYGRVKVTGFDSFFENGKVPLGDVAKIGLPQLRSFLGSKTITVTGITNLQDALDITLKHDGVKIDFDHSLFKSGTLTYAEMIALAPTRLLQQYSAKVMPVTVTGVHSLNEALRLVVDVKVKTDFDHSLFKSGRLNYAELEELPPRLFEKYAAAYQVIVEGVPDLKKAINVANKYKVKVAGFDDFFERGEVSQEQFDTINVTKAQKVLGTSKRLTVTAPTEPVSLGQIKRYGVKSERVG